MALYRQPKEENGIRLPLLVLLGTLLFFHPCPVLAQPARLYVDSALVAMGGRDALLGLKNQRIVSHGENFEPEQAVRPGGEPRKASTFTCTLIRDLTNGNVRYEWQRETFPPLTATWRYSEILSGDQGAILGADGARSPAQHAASAARIAARRKELSRSPVSVLLNALARSSSLLRLADQLIYASRHYVVSYNDGGQFVIIALDAQSRLPTKVEFLEDDPLAGDTNNELFFTDWRQVGALKLPFELTYRVNGQIVMTEHIDSIENNIDVNAVGFTIPEDLSQTDTTDGRRGEQSSQWILRRIALASPLDDEQTRVELTEVAKGVFHVTGGTHHSLAIEMADHLVVVDAPLYEERSQAVLAALRKKFPGKPVRFIVSTHFHNDHSGGLRAYVAAGAIVVTGKVNEQFHSQAFRAKHTRVPDSLQGNPKPAVIETVGTEKKVLTDDARVVEIYPITNSHAEGMLVVYLPREKLLFVTDLFSPGAPRQVSAWCGELLAAVEQYDLKVERIAGGHGNKLSTLAELRQAAASPAP
ncbi:MAG TPA: MBL fold metallo-hydrolase [Candidatus Binatia bacterium]|nr:MBL fold metallo-hydrolase [Candidatus Binatia bacterium]